MSETSEKINIVNKKAYFDYEFIEKFEAGIVLTGLEIKAIRARKVNLTGSYLKIIKGEVLWLGGNFNFDKVEPQRTKKLLLNKAEIEKLAGKVVQTGFALIPIRLYLKHGKAKLEIALARGKKEYDKRAVMKKREQERESGRSVKQF